MLAPSKYLPCRRVRPGRLFCGPASNLGARAFVVPPSTSKEKEHPLITEPYLAGFILAAPLVVAVVEFVYFSRHNSSEMTKRERT